MNYTYKWYKNNFPPTIYDGVATAENGEYEVRIGGVTHGVVFGNRPPFLTSSGDFHSLEDAKNALIKSFEENEEKYLEYKTAVGGFKPRPGLFFNNPENPITISGYKQVNSILIGHGLKTEESDVIVLGIDKEMLKLCKNGNIYVDGKLVDNDKEIVDALRSFVTGIKQVESENDDK